MDMELLAKAALEALAGQFGAVAQALALLAMIIGSARMVMKPLREVLGVVVKLTKSEKDDMLLAKAEGSKALKLVAFLADFILSIKLPAKK